MSFGQRRIDPSHLKPEFQKFSELLKKWNKTYNLTAITDDKSIAIKHFEDSLAPLHFLPSQARILDLGCGAGFPGIPLKIENSDLEVILLDSVKKKIAFCEAVIRELKLQNILAVCGRAEDSEMIKKLGCFDAVISRATFSITTFLKLAKPFLKKDAKVIMMKGPEWMREEKPNDAEWKLDKIFDYELTENLGRRSLLIFKSNFAPL